MTWLDFLSTTGGWGMSAILVAEFLRRLTRGEFVLKSQYDLVVKAANDATNEAKAAVEKQGEASKQTIATQSELIKAQAAIIQSSRKEGGNV